MHSWKLLISASVLAALATPALSQTDTNQSTVSQTGIGNTAAIDNARPGNTANSSNVNQIGNNNRATVLQIGNLNISRMRQLGNQNEGQHFQVGNRNLADSYQDRDLHWGLVDQIGDDNSVLVSQIGIQNSSTVQQGTRLANNDPGNRANANSVIIDQNGTLLTSTVNQRAGQQTALGVIVSNNTARVRQRGAGNSSLINQESRGNFAEAFMFEGGTTTATRNQSTITQRDPTATALSNPLSNNRASVAIRGEGNVSTVAQTGRNNNAEVTLGPSRTGTVQVTQQSAAGSLSALLSQSGNSNSIIVGQHSAEAVASVWQQAGPIAARNSNNQAEVQQGTGTTGTAAFSSAFFGQAAPVGAATTGLSASISQGNNPERSAWNVAQIRQDGTNLTATIQQQGIGTADHANLVRIAQQGGSAGGNQAVAIQRAGVGPSEALAASPTGQPGDEFYFAGGARAAEIAILQSGNNNSATAEQRGRGQFARIEQGPGSGNEASILQEVNATNASAIIRQTGSNNSYSVTQTEAFQYILVSQTGNNNAITNVVTRPNP